MRIIISISSDIGAALASDWLSSGYEVWGTYRNWSAKCEDLRKHGAVLEFCDLIDSNSIQNVLSKFPKYQDWSTLVLAAGDQKPIGLFHEIDFEEWAKSVQSNLLGQLHLLHGFMNVKSEREGKRTVILFAGGGTNNATERYSAYTISKIASIKICELLDFEYQDYKFACLGPGWVESKIHNSTIEAGVKAGKNFEKTKMMRSGSLMNPMRDVIECCNWVIESEKSVVGGRNFSVVHDSWRSSRLYFELQNNSEIYKLRRFGNKLKND